jgi:hypothetical protein
MRAFTRVCVELSALLVGTVTIGLVSAWALPLAGLLLTLAGLTVLIERERAQLDEPVELPRPALPAPSAGPSTALVAYRPPGPLMPWKPS